MTIRSIFNLDPLVSEYETLISSLSEGSDGMLLEGGHDGVLKVREILANHVDLDAIQTAFQSGPSALNLGGVIPHFDNLQDCNLTDVEIVQFGTAFQTSIPLSQLTSGNAQLQLGRLTDLYLAFFGRAPDVSGLEYWQEQLLEKGRSLTDLAKEFAWSNEARALFPQNGSNRDFVKTVYQNCFGRGPDQGGWDYWSAKLDGKGTTDLGDRGAFVGELLLGAYAPTSGATDRALLSNRHEAALHYVNKLSNMPSEGFDAGINALLARVTGDARTEDQAEHVIDYAFPANPVTLHGVL